MINTYTFFNIYLLLTNLNWKGFVDYVLMNYLKKNKKNCLTLFNLNFSNIKNYLHMHAWAGESKIDSWHRYGYRLHAFFTCRTWLRQAPSSDRLRSCLFKADLPGSGQAHRISFCCSVTWLCPDITVLCRWLYSETVRHWTWYTVF